MQQAVRFGVVLATVFLMGSTALAQYERSRDEWLSQPVDDSTFEAYLSFFTYDAALPFDVELLDREEQEGIVKEHLSFQSTPGDRVFANHFEVATPGTGSKPGMILLHGGGRRGKDGLGVIRYATDFARSGFSVLAIDMQYFGERDTGVMTTFTEPDKHASLYNQPSLYLEWVAQTVKDVGRAFDLLIERGADETRIGLWGNSRGAVVGIIAAAAERRIAAALISYGGHFDGLERQHLAAACPANYIGRISPRPLLMANGTFDADFDKIASVDPMFALAGEPKTILWTEGGHGRISAENRDRLFAWVRETLKE